MHHGGFLSVISHYRQTHYTLDYFKLCMTLDVKHPEQDCGTDPYNDSKNPI